MFDEPEIWRNVRNFPGYEISSEGRVRDGYGDLIPPTRKSGELYVHFTYYSYSYQGPVWRLILYSFFEFNISEWKEVECHYRDGNAYNLDIFNLSFYMTDGVPLMFTRSPSGDWKRVRRNSRPVKIIETGQEFVGAKEMAEEMGFSLNAVYLVLRGKSKTHHGFHFEYIS